MYRSSSWIGVAFGRRTMSRATVRCVSQPGADIPWRFDGFQIAPVFEVVVRRLALGWGMCRPPSHHLVGQEIAESANNPVDLFGIQITEAFDMERTVRLAVGSLEQMRCVSFWP